MPTHTLLDQFAVKIYEPPLSALRDNGGVADLCNPLSVAMLLVDFETEVSMNGINNFIGNSTGRYINETIAALTTIGCHDDAALLSRILAVASAAGMTHQTIQAERSALEEFAITSFSQLHDSKWNAASAEIGQLASAIDFGRIIGNVDEFISKHEQVFKDALRT